MTDNNGKADQITGKAKELFGKLTGDKKTEAEGNLEQTVGKVKDSVDSAVDTVKDAIEKGKDQTDKKVEEIKDDNK